MDGLIGRATARVGILMGGLSPERSISLKTGAGVLGALRERGWDVVEIRVGRDLPEVLRRERISVAWIALHGRFGEDGCVQGLLEMMGIPYTGSGVQASAVGMDKIATKRALRHIPSVFLAVDATWRRGESLPEILFPAIVKPPTSGSTIGIKKVETIGELEVALHEALKYDEEILIEQLILGEEITVPVLDGEALPVVRIVPDSGFFDFDAKYTKGLTTYECPANLSQKASGAAQLAAKSAYRALGCRGLARADFIVQQDGTPIFLEINTIPGMTATSLSPMAAAVVGMSYPELCEQILLGAVCMSALLDPHTLAP